MVITASFMGYLLLYTVIPLFFASMIAHVWAHHKGKDAEYIEHIDTFSTWTLLCIESTILFILLFSSRAYTGFGTHLFLVFSAIIAPSILLMHHKKHLHDNDLLDV